MTPVLVLLVLLVLLVAVSMAACRIQATEPGSGTSIRRSVVRATVIAAMLLVLFLLFILFPKPFVSIPLYPQPARLTCRPTCWRQ